MSRPKRPRCIISRPVIKAFRPEGVEETEEVVLSLEEFEAIRHVDFEGLDQSQAADIMNVSRQTFGRILRAGRFNLSKAIVQGCSFKVEGGCYTLHDDDGYDNGRHGHGRCRGHHGHGMGNGHGRRGI